MHWDEDGNLVFDDDLKKRALTQKQKIQFDAKRRAHRFEE